MMRLTHRLVNGSHTLGPPFSLPTIPALTIRFVHHSGPIIGGGEFRWLEVGIRWPAVRTSRTARNRPRGYIGSPSVFFVSLFFFAGVTVVWLGEDENYSTISRALESLYLTSFGLRDWPVENEAA